MAAMAEAYGTRPSELLGVDGHWIAFCLDEALFARLALARDEQRDGRSRYRPQGFDLPPVQVRAKIPWAGEGPDPLGGSL
jgi:hypothetical protein